SGADTQTVNLPGNGIYSIVLHVKSIITNGIPDMTRLGMARGNVVIPSTVVYDESLTQSTDQSSTQTSTNQSNTQTGQAIVIPPWIKNNAKLWASGQIDDPTFVSGIQYLIKQGIIQLPATTAGQSTSSVTVPPWVKNNAGLWASGQIDDQTFVSGIQYLIQIGIIVV
ncbi:MAG: hypothetical protein ACREBJ_09565, partial [Nitrosotalea sp.]